MRSEKHRMINTVAAAIALLVLIAHSESAEPFKLDKGDVIAFTGGTNAVRSDEAGCLEALLTRRFAGASLRFRDLSWEGDTVFRQSTVSDRWREEAFGGWSEQLRRVEATVMFAQFGQIEALRGKEGLKEFVAAYERLIDVFMKCTQRVVLISPTPFEKTAPRRTQEVFPSSFLAVHVPRGRRVDGRDLEGGHVLTDWERRGIMRNLGGENQPSP